MRDASVVAKGDANHELLTELPRPRKREPVALAAAEELHERHGPCILHPQQDVTARVDRAQEGHDVLVLKLPDGVDLGRDTQDLVDRAVVELREDLHRLVLGGRAVVGLAHGAEAAPAEERLDGEVPDNGADVELRGRRLVEPRQHPGDAQLAGVGPEVLGPLQAQLLLAVEERFAVLVALLLADARLPKVVGGARVVYALQSHEHGQVRLGGAHALQYHLV
mmetsp:Transcript_111491/g.311677  ORF Transcript_111491/g.311677 Transcript_111491/m.311677 type:complete len:222 (-) Transcript_111491:458-1123(-)